MLGLSIPELAQRRRAAGGFPVTVSLLGPTLHPGIAITRASTGTRITATGQIETIGVDAARFDHDPVSNAPLGLMAEAQATNLVDHAVADTTDWSNLLCTVSTLSLNEMGLFPGLQVASGGATWHRVNVTTGAWTSGTSYRVKAWFKAGSSGRMLLNLRNVDEGNESTVSGNIGAFTVANSSAGTVSSIDEVVLANGVRVVELTFVPAADTAIGQLGIGPGSNTAGEDVILLGAQIEAGIDATSLILSSGTAATRNADGIVLNAWTGTHDLEITYSDAATETRPAVSLAPGYVLTPLAGKRATSLKII